MEHSSYSRYLEVSVHIPSVLSTSLIWLSHTHKLKLLYEVIVECLCPSTIWWEPTDPHGEDTFFCAMNTGRGIGQQHLWVGQCVFNWWSLVGFGYTLYTNMFIYDMYFLTDGGRVAYGGLPVEDANCAVPDAGFNYLIGLFQMSQTI